MPAKEAASPPPSTLAELTGDTAIANLQPGQALVVGAASKVVNRTVKHEQLIGDGAATDIAVPHNLDTSTPSVSVYEVATGQAVTAVWEVTDANTVTVYFGSAPAANAYRVVVKAQ